MCNIFKSNSITKVLTLCLLISSTNINAQKVRCKKGKVIINETEVFNYKSTNTGRGEARSLYNINSNQEAIFIKENNGGTTSEGDFEKDDFVTFIFLKEKINVERSGIADFDWDIRFLYNEGVFDLKGNLDLEKIILFKEKYDEKISEKTIISK